MQQKSVEDQYFNLMSGIADSYIDAPDSEIAALIVEDDATAEYPEHRCAYLCPAHLEPCGRAKYHRGDCYCHPEGHSQHIKCVMDRAIQLTNHLFGY